MAERDFWEADRREVLTLAAARLERLGRRRDAEKCRADLAGDRP